MDFSLSKLSGFCVFVFFCAFAHSVFFLLLLTACYALFPVWVLVQGNSCSILVLFIFPKLYVEIPSKGKNLARFGERVYHNSVLQIPPSTLFSIVNIDCECECVIGGQQRREAVGGQQEQALRQATEPLHTQPAGPVDRSDLCHLAYFPVCLRLGRVAPYCANNVIGLELRCFSAKLKILFQPDVEYHCQPYICMVANTKQTFRPRPP